MGIRVGDDPGCTLARLHRHILARHTQNLTFKMTTTKPADLAALTTRLLQDTDACPTAPLTDVACAIADQFEDALAALVVRLQATSDRQDARRAYTKREWNVLRPIFSVEPRRKGWRFAKIIRTSFYNVRVKADGTSDGEPSVNVVGFVEAGTGLMWKAATRKAPALNFPRGCIFTLPDDWKCDGSFDSLTTSISLEVKP
jgi:hypothetical protein